MPGVFHKLSEEMKVSLLTMATADASKTRHYDCTALMKQREAKKHKQQLLQQYNLKNASEHYIDSL